MTAAESVVLKLWRNGEDSAEIAAMMNVEEAWVCRVIAAEQDRRHAIRRREAQRA